MVHTECGIKKTPHFLWINYTLLWKSDSSTMVWGEVCRKIPHVLPECTSNICMRCLIHSFIHSGHFYSAPSSPVPLRGAPDYSTDTVSEFHAEAHRQLQVKDLPKVPT